MVSLLNDKTKKRLPKGPWGLPLVGYLPFLGKFPHFTLWKLSEKYGNIYTLPVGMQNIVILNDWNSIKDSLKKDSFLGLVDENSLSWREERRVYENLFKTSFDSSIIYKNMLIEMRCLLIYLRKTNQNPLQLRVNFSKSECKTHYKTLRNESSVRDLIDGYLVELKGKKAHSVPTTMSIEKLRANCQVFLSFGTEAFLSCLEWSLISIAYYPGHQKMISEEVERVMGGQRIPEFKDALRMPFTVAFLNEVLRWKTVLPFNFIRRAIEDASILGCFIPKDTLVLCNIWAVHHDPTIWPDPFRFDPTRFLSDDQKSLIEYPEGFMPFSLGKRSCVAEPFVRKLLFLYIVSIVQKFSLSTLNGEEIFDEEYNTTVRPKSQVNLVFKLKHPPPPPPPDECLSGSTHPT
ncbi:PREDICTED: cytochrome P450 2C7-like [Rhagoletis zephyria]|uniref:cytochrome P450 2C7-like n=1 Tax=Rhagoletis zephyria TaxID=28612 RepID=UPI0008117D49|nr:PREDICTED: cytochrome P450 2C7-like [Rhagoletis zephyria]